MHESTNARHQPQQCSLLPREAHAINRTRSARSVRNLARLSYLLSGAVGGGPESPLASLDHFVGRGQQRRRDGEAEGFGGFQIDDQLETRRLFDRQIAGLCAFQDLVDVADRPGA
jgi:hypothetical protein